MTNNLALKETATAVEINKAFGFDSRMKPVIPLLKINGADDEDGTRAPKGTFTYDDGTDILYANEVSIRSFLKAYQYRLFDGKDPSKNDNSIIAMSFKEEFRSTSGRIACGKMNKKAYFQLGDTVSATQKYFQDSVKCKLLVFGLVSGKFTNLDTKAEVEIIDQLFTWQVSQSGFMAIDQAITGIEKERRAVPLTPIKISLKKEKQGSVTYFQPIPEVLNKTEKLDIVRDSGFLTQIKDFVKATNDYVNEKYSEKYKGQQDGRNFANAAIVVEGNTKSADLEDPLDDM